MQQQEKYTLHWHSYSDHLRKALNDNDMMISSEFADVTLVTDDKQQIRAHRNILSACSPVFKSILQIDSKNTNPVIYLRGIQHPEMESIMQFIYLGEAKFYEERMREFLQVSKELEIKELSTGIEKNDQTSSDETSSKHENSADEDVYEDPTPAQTESRNCSDDNDQTQTTNIPTVRTNAAKRKVSRTDGGSQYSCNQCDKQFAQQSSLTRHIQSAHEGVKYACYQCDYQATQQYNLTTHIQSVHEGVKYGCNQCEYQATQQINLTTHIKKKHL